MPSITSSPAAPGRSLKARAPAVERCYEDLQAFAASTTLGDLLRSASYASSKRRTTPVVAVHGEQAVADVLSVFLEEQVVAAPVWAADTEYQGFVDIFDVLDAFIRLLRPELLSAQYLRDHRTAAMHELNEAARAFLARPIETVAWRKDGQLWFEDDCGFSLREVISQGFMLPQEPMRATLHRIGVFAFDAAPEPEGAPLKTREPRQPAKPLDVAPSDAVVDQPVAEEGSKQARVDTSHALRWSIRHVVSQWDFVCFLHEAHAEKRLPALDGIAVSDLPPSTPTTAPCDTPTLPALHSIARLRVSGLALTHPASESTIIGHVSSTDFRGLTPEWFAYLTLPIAEFAAAAARAGGGQRGFKEAWEGQRGVAAGEGERWEELLSHCRPVCCTLGDPLSLVVRHMATLGIHQVWVVDDRQALVGVVTPSDILSCMATCVGTEHAIRDEQDFDRELTRLRADQGSTRLRAYNTPFPVEQGRALEGRMAELAGMGGSTPGVGKEGVGSGGAAASHARADVSAAPGAAGEAVGEAEKGAAAPPAGDVASNEGGVEEAGSGVPRLSAGASEEGVGRVRQEAREAMARVLGGLTVEEALRELPGQEVFAVEASRPCGVALQDMARAGRDSCPVVWPGGKFRGYFSVLDVFRSLLDALEVEASLEEAAVRVTVLPVASLMRADTDGARWDDLGASLLSLVSRGLMRSQSAPHFHRIVVCDADGRPVRVVCQLDLARLLLSHLHSLGHSVLSATLSQLGLVTPHVFTVHGNEPALSALARVSEMGLTGAAVVDPATGQAVTHVTLADLRGLTAKDMPALLRPILEFVLCRREAGARRAHWGGSRGERATGTGGDIDAGKESREGAAAAEALGLDAGMGVEVMAAVQTGQAGQARGTGGGGSGRGGEGGTGGAHGMQKEGAKGWVPEELVVCHRETRFEQLLSVMAEAGAHRVFTLDAGGRPDGVVSITDVLREACCA